jgi:membrane protein implicated in regulation of membrane protease activity
MIPPADTRHGITDRLRHEARGLVRTLLLAVTGALLLVAGGILAIAGGYGWLSSFMTGYQAAFLLATLLVVAGAIVIACMLRPRRPHLPAAGAAAPGAAPGMQAAVTTAIARNPLPTLAAAIAAGAVYGFLKENR